MSKQINIGGRIHSTEVGNVSVGANEVFDDTKGKKQNVINSETDAELLRLDQSKQNNLTFDNAPTEDSNNPVKSSGVYAADKALSDAIEAIMLLIPSAATALNQLADKAFVNSSVSTATATFRGTYNVVTDLELAYDATHEQIVTKLGQVIATADNNDYAFVQVPVSATSTDIRRTERYKFNGTVWGYEYDLNTSGFTQAQWEAINSAITAALVQKLSALPTAQELAAALLGKQDVLTFDNAPASGSSNPVKSGGVYTAVNDEKVARENADTGLGNSITAIENVIPSAATSSNKLVDNASMADAIGVVTAIIGQMDATFNLTTTDGHITLHVTQENGAITSVQVQSSDIASAAALTLVANDLSALTTRVGTAEGNITSLTGRMTTAEGDIETLQDLYNALQQSAPQVIEPTDTWPVANPSNTVIYRVIDRVNTPPEYYSDYMWNGTSMVLMATYNNAIDTTPKKGSANLITSGGVFANIGAFDVSEYHKSGGTLATYADLSAALAAIPSEYQKGGMSIKFVLTSDNKYVQFRYMSSSTAAADFANVTNWQGVDTEPIKRSKNLVEGGGIYKLLYIDTEYPNNYLDSNGELVTNNDWFVVEYLLSNPIAENDAIVWYGADNYTNAKLGFYDSLGVLKIAYSATGIRRDITIPNNAAVGCVKLRASYKKSNESSAYLSLNGQILTPNNVIVSKELLNGKIQFGFFNISPDGYNSSSVYSISSLDYIDVTGFSSLVFSGILNEAKKIDNNIGTILVNVHCYDSAYNSLGRIGFKDVTNKIENYNFLAGTKYVRVAISPKTESGGHIDISSYSDTLIEKSDDIVISNCYPTIIKNARLFPLLFSDIEVLNDTTLSKNAKFYTGEKISIAGRYNLIDDGSFPTGFTYDQGFAIYGDYCIQGTLGESGNDTLAALINMQTREVISTLNLSHSGYSAIHCNTMCFGKEIITNGIMPLLYASQWDGEKCCFIYDVQLNGATLKQVISPANLTKDGIKFGRGNVDWVVDIDNNFLFAVSYVNVGFDSAQIVTKFNLPLLSDGALIELEDTDIISYNTFTNYIVRQDCCYNNGKLYISCGAGLEYIPYLSLHVVDTTSLKEVSFIDLQYLGEEIEGLDVYKGNLMLHTAGSAKLMKFIF